MNRAVLQRAGLTLRIIPPRDDCKWFPLPSDYEEAIASIQRLRGSVYVSDGALSPAALSPDGRHYSELDFAAYHLTLWNGQLQGCLRVVFHPEDYSLEKFKVYEVLKRMPLEQSETYRMALKQFLCDWRKRGLPPGESGGWAISEAVRRNAAAIALPLSAWALSRIRQREVFLATATERHGSKDILHRLGGWKLQGDGKELPEFFDSAFGCKMNFICFDSEVLNPKFEAAVADLQEFLLGQTEVGGKVAQPNSEPAAILPVYFKAPILPHSHQVPLRPRI